MSVKIVTGEGSFTAGEVMAVSTLKNVYRDAQIVRTNDADDIASAKIDSASILVGIGSEYDPDKDAFDVPEGGAGSRGSGVQFLPFGLVWETYGRAALNAQRFPVLEVDTVFDAVHDQLVEPIDAADQGKNEAHASIATFIRNLNAREDLDAAFSVGVRYGTEILRSYIRRFATQ